MAARICLIAAGDMSSPEVATSTVSIRSAATTMRAKPARLRAATSASRIRRCVASLIWSVARKCRRDLHAEAIRGRRAARPFEPSTGFTCRNAFSNGGYLACSRRTCHGSDRNTGRPGEHIIDDRTSPSHRNLRGCRCLPGQARDLSGSRAASRQGVGGGEQLHQRAARSFGGARAGGRGFRRCR